MPQKRAGFLEVRPGVEPERFKDDSFENAAITGILQVDSDAFETLRSQVADAFNHGRGVSVKVALIGQSLPEKEGRFFLDDIDVSVRRTYAVSHFEINTGGPNDLLRDFLIEPEQDEGKGTSISIKLLKAVRRYSSFICSMPPKLRIAA